MTDRPSNASNWQEELRSAIATVVLRWGRPVRPYGDDYSSWVYSTYRNDEAVIRQHAETCPFAVSGEVRPVAWSAFEDTEQPNVNRHGLVTVASCACGLFKDVTWLYERDLGTMMRDLLEVTSEP
jgi:hypothetical protein